MTSPRLGTVPLPPVTVAEGEARTPARRIASGLHFHSEGLLFHEVCSLMGRGRCLPLIPGSVAERRLARRRCACPSIAEMLVVPVSLPWLALNLRWGRDQGSR